MMLKRDSMMLGGQFLKNATAEKVYWCSQVGACSVLLLHLCKRGFFFNWCVWKSAASFDPFLSGFCIMLQHFGKSWLNIIVCTKVLLRNVCILFSLIPCLLLQIHAWSLLCTVRVVLLQGLTGLKQRCPLVLTGWKCHWEYTDVLQHLGDEVHILSRVTSCEN